MRQRVQRVLKHEIAWETVGRWALVVLVAFAGALIGMLLAGTRSEQVGPLQVKASVVPSITGDSVIEVPPLGSIKLDTHDGPLRLRAVVTGVNADATSDLVAGSVDIGTRDELLASIRTMVTIAYVRAIVAGALGAGVAVLLVWRRPRRAGAAALVTVGLFVGIATLGAATWNQRSLSQPSYSGLLIYAPNVIGRADEVVEDFDLYGDQLARLVGNVSQLSTAVTSLPTFEPDPETIRVLHVSDIHLNPSVWPIIKTIIEQYAVDIVVDTGDIADHGSTVEAGLLDPIGSLDVPYVFVRGNHDSLIIENAIAGKANAVVVDGEVVDVGGLRFLGSGDPRFTPDKDVVAGDDLVVAQGEQLAEIAASLADPVDVLLVHDPTAAPPLIDAGPLILSGHVHERRDEQLDEDTQLLVQGSSGGAGLRALESEEPTPLTFTVLYFERDTGRLQARDEITLGGLGTSTAEVTRIQTPAEPVGRTS